MSSTQAKQPPRLFVPHGKRVLVAAHRLVFVGDTLGRLAASAPLRAQVGAAGTALGQALRATVLPIKGAALGYPSSPAAQGRQCLRLPRASEPVLRTAWECRPILGFHIWLLGPHTGTGWAGFRGIQQVALPSVLRAASGSLEQPGCLG